MKMIKAVIKPHKLEPVHEALLEIGVPTLTATEVKGYDKEMQHAEVHRGTQYRVAFMPMIKIEAIVEDELVDNAIAAIRTTAGTTQKNDGRIYVSEMIGAESI
ncbi:MAG: P-II family nitrogen regulator [Roseovarius sp.]|nr:P-II family nitrogen regulator [Roseovarius sp.]MCY4208355.1 P-II family nitrogen regulator [Roseovarius sp.]MCY4293040.1 P-II family nitrogen regulator [Roseovarius sp.]MCY4317514.1 P-II family nitrogen regulator [Roseovarius sp.]